MAKDLTDALRQLTERPSYEPNVTPSTRGAARRVVSAAPPPGVTSGGGGGPAASPWTETSRTYWPTAWQTTDGLFSFPAVRKVTFLDADGATVELNFADPSA